MARIRRVGSLMVLLSAGLVALAVWLSVDDSGTAPRPLDRVPVQVDASSVAGPEVAVESEALAVDPDRGVPAVATSAGRVRLTLRVVDAEGHAVAGATVEHGLVHGARSESTTLSDEAGHWSGEVPELAAARDAWSVIVRAPGYVPDGLALPFLPRGAFDLGVFRLARTARLEGLVVDERGRPLPGARVAALFQKRGITGSVVRPAAETAVADDQGTFEMLLRPVEPHHSLTFAAWHPQIGGPAEVTFTNPLEAVRDGVELCILPGVELMGFVVDTAGAPLAGAEVNFSAPPYSSLASQTADERGVFRLRASPDRPLVLEVSKEGYLPTAMEPHEVMSPRTGLALEMMRACSLEIHAFDRQTGEPLSEFAVSLCALFDRFSRCFDGEGHAGRAVIDGLPAGTWRPIVVSAEGYESRTIAWDIQAEGQRAGPYQVALEPRERTSSVSGRVLDAGGHPASGTSISISAPRGSRGAIRGGSAMADAEGRFELASLESGPAILVAQRARGERSRPIELRLEPELDHTVELRLEPAARLEGRLVDGAGQPLPGALLNLVPALGADLDALAVLPTGRTDETGHFRLEGIPHGRFRLEIWTRPSGCVDPLVVPWVGLDLEPGDDRRLHLVAAPRQTVRGTLIGADQHTVGAHVVAAPVPLVVPGADWTSELLDGFEAALDKTGRFELHGLAPGRYVLRLVTSSGEEFLAETVTIEPHMSGLNEIVFRR